MILGLFDGPGGWSEGLKTLGLRDFGIDDDRWVAETRYAAGHSTLLADLADLDPLLFADCGVEGLIGSPPCQSFSAAGSRAGLDDERGQLVWVPMRWALALHPRWVALEQVPEVLPIWRHVARCLSDAGYGTWTGVLNAADYGVPQTRRRAILLAHRERPVQPPPATHAKQPGDTMFGARLLPWVMMADALGWDAGVVDQGHGQAPEFDSVTAPARTMVKAARSWKVRTNNRTSTTGDYYRRTADHPSPTMLGSARSWAWERPATTLTCDPRLFGPHASSKGESHSENTTLLSIEEALILQGFRPDYPVHGGRGKQFEQIGNAVPPPFAAAILKQVVA